MSGKKIQVIAYYLPQFHTIPENDKWWGPGFTEWVNVKKARPLFRGHNQPNIPSPELGYYDLLDNNVRKKQTDLAKEAGIDAFCYWHYWFGNGRELLEKPFRMMLEDKCINHGFCLGWANETWKRKQWNKDGLGDIDLIKQLYPGREDDEKHFYAYLGAFKDERYVRVDGKPVFLIYRPKQHPYIKDFITHWNKLAIENGLGDSFCFIAEMGAKDSYRDADYYRSLGFSYVTLVRANINQAPLLYKFWYSVKNLLLGRPIRVIDYNSYISWAYTKRDNARNIVPGLCPNWDHSPRSGRKCTILHNSTPQLFYNLVKNTITINKRGKCLPLLFIKSWNEWGEGNYMEPDTRFGRDYIDALNKALEEQEEK